MNTCENCFNDRVVLSYISRNSTSSGVCDYCGANNVQVIDAPKLKELFEVLVDAYSPNGGVGGKFLHEHFDHDWKLWNGLQKEGSARLLLDIIGNTSFLSNTFLPIRVKNSTNQTKEAWDEFCDEILHQNRFIFNNKIAEGLAEVLAWLVVEWDDLGPTRIFRARKSVDGVCFSATEMGMPPRHMANAGRANPSGIPYLYTALDMDTAISEVRPYVGDKVCIGFLDIVKNIRVVDLRDPMFSISPFDFADGPEIASVRPALQLLTHLGNELSRPISANDVATDYIPTQFLSEFVKSMNYDGILHKSAATNGKGSNLVLFDDTKVACREVAFRSIVDVALSHSLITP